MTVYEKIIEKRNSSWKPNVHGWMIDKMWYNYTMEYYSALKGMKFRHIAETQMNLKDVVLSERSQSQKATIV